MTRCHRTAAPLAAGLGFCLSILSAGLLPASTAHADSSTDSNTIVPMAWARPLPPASLRGELVLTNPPEVTLNGKVDRLAPGSRMRGQNNMFVMPGVAIGQKLVVNYTREAYGLILDVWVLRDDERAKLWPKTSQEAAKWQFDPVAQTWTKP